MTKIKLDVEELRVESYPTTRAGLAAGGTVHGQEMDTMLGNLTCASACSATDGAHACKSCGPCCYE